MNKEFAILLYQLSQKLQRDEIDAIRFIEDLPADLEGKSGLLILIQLQMQGKITDTDPSTLQGVLKKINRMDLVNRVKEFVKSSQKKSKKTMDRNSEELLFRLKANLEVSLLQAKLLCGQLKNQAFAAEKSGMKSVQHMTLEAISFVENEVESRLLCAKEEMLKKNSSSPELSDDDETQSRTQGLNKSPIVPPDQEVLKNPTQEEEDLYEEVPNFPHIATALHMRRSYMAGVLPSSGTQTRPSSMCIMNAIHVTGSLDRDYPNTRDMSKPMPAPKPSYLKSKQRVIENDMDSGTDDCTFSGGTCSLSDSGFVDTKRYLRCPVVAPRSASEAGTKTSPVVASRPPAVPVSRLPPKPHRYMPINTDQVRISYYKATSREDNRYQKLVNGDVKSTKDTCEHQLLYENVR